MRYMYLSKSCISVCISFKLHRIASILYFIAYIIFCQRYTGVRLYLLDLIIDDRSDLLPSLAACIPGYRRKSKTSDNKGYINNRDYLH